VAEPLSIALSMQNGSSATVSLRSIFKDIEAVASADERASLALAFVESVLELVAAQKQPDATGAIMPVVRTRAQVQALSTQLGQAKDAALYEPLAADLFVTYVLDRPGSVKYLSELVLRDLKVPRADLRDLALGNLDRTVQIKRLGFNDMFTLAAGEFYESSLLLFDGLWDDMAKAVQGDVVAAVPSRESLIFTGSDNRPGLENWRKLVYESHGGAANPLSRALLVRAGGQWQEYNSGTTPARGGMPAESSPPQKRSWWKLK
jgi:uncharacterized protein YtpQ (UPF0354 family)